MMRELTKNFERLDQALDQLETAFDSKITALERKAEENNGLSESAQADMRAGVDSAITKVETLIAKLEDH